MLINYGSTARENMGYSLVKGSFFYEQFQPYIYDKTVCPKSALIFKSRPCPKLHVVIFSRFYLLATTGFLSKRQITKRSKWFASIYFKPKQQRSISSQQLEK